MVEFTEFIKRFVNLEKFLKSKAPELLLKNQAEIIELHKKQLMQGKNVQGKLMQRGYSTAYAKRRKKAGLQTGFVDLNFTGKYQDTKKGVKADKGMNIISGVDYEKYLRGNFPDHVGLTKKDAEIVANSMAKEIAVMIDKYLD